MEAFESFEHAGMTCELHQDWDPSSPAEWDQLGTLVNFDRNAPGESQPFGIVGSDTDAAERGGAALLVRYLRLTRGIIAVPFRFSDYGSSGAHISAASRDEESPSGYIFTTPERCAELGVDLADAERQLHGELSEWDSYVSGEVCGYIVRDPAGEVVDSVWGFYPDAEGDGLNELRAEARSAAQHEANERSRLARWYAFGNVVLS